MRMLRISSVSVVIAAAAALAACTDRLVESPPLGGSVAQNVAAQIVDPNPDSTEVAPPLNGERNNVAQKRYEKGKVLKPRSVNTTSSLGSNSNSGNGSQGQ